MRSSGRLVIAPTLYPTILRDNVIKLLQIRLPCYKDEKCVKQKEPAMIRKQVLACILFVG